MSNHPCTWREDYCDERSSLERGRVLSNHNREGHDQGILYQSHNEAGAQNPDDGMNNPYHHDICDHRTLNEFQYRSHGMGDHPDESQYDDRYE